jgi:hypothetical protein
MNISDFAQFNSRLDELGKIVPGVNTTCDVGTDATVKQALKFGNKVSKGGISELTVNSKKAVHLSLQ